MSEEVKLSKSAKDKEKQAQDEAKLKTLETVLGKIEKTYGKGAVMNMAARPTTDGNVDVRVEMSESLPLEFRLYSPDGALLQKETRTADTYHATRCYLPMNGTYVLEMSSGESRQTVKLIRK